MFLCLLSYLLCCVSNSKLCTCFYSFCLHEKCIFHWGQEPGGVVARIPSFHPGYPGSIPGQGITISFHATTHCCLSEISTNRLAPGRIATNLKFVGKKKEAVSAKCKRRYACTVYICVLFDFHRGYLPVLWSPGSEKAQLQTLRHPRGWRPRPGSAHSGYAGRGWVRGEPGDPGRGSRLSPVPRGPAPGCWEAAPGCRAATCPSTSGKLSAAATEAGTRESQTQGWARAAESPGCPRRAPRGSAAASPSARGCSAPGGQQGPVLRSPGKGSPSSPPAPAGSIATCGGSGAPRPFPGQASSAPSGSSENWLRRMLVAPVSWRRSLGQPAAGSEEWFSEPRTFPQRKGRFPIFSCMIRILYLSNPLIV